MKKRKWLLLAFLLTFTLPAAAEAVCNSVTTPVISLNGLVYWCAYERKQESMPTLNTAGLLLHRITSNAPTTATAAYTTAFTKRVPGLVSAL